jgi:hypothetical protein
MVIEQMIAIKQVQEHQETQEELGYIMKPVNPGNLVDEVTTAQDQNLGKLIGQKHGMTIHDYKNILFKFPKINLVLLKEEEEEDPYGVKRLETEVPV